jgi:hypothetical protein
MRDLDDAGGKGGPYRQAGVKERNSCALGLPRRLTDTKDPWCQYRSGRDSRRLSITLGNSSSFVTSTQKFCSASRPVLVVEASLRLNLKDPL